VEVCEVITYTEKNDDGVIKVGRLVIPVSTISQKTGQVVASLHFLAKQKSKN